MNKREAYLEKAQARLKRYEAEIEQLKAEAKLKQTDAQESAERGFKKAKTQLQALKESGDEAFAELRSGTEQALDELKQAVNNASKQFN